LFRGESQDKNTEPFREWFSRIGELRALCPNTQMVALTATAGPTNRRKIMKQLCFSSNAEIIVESPDRSNIKLSSKCIPNNDQIENVFAWLISSLTMLKEEMPRHVIFCETISDVSKLYMTFLKIFGSKCELINMYHSKTNDKIKDYIRSDMAQLDGKIRVLICTNSAGMGVNFVGVHNIVHYGLPREMDTFVQQMGRCGRDGVQSNELILFKNHKGHLKKVECELVKLVKDDTECRRINLCKAYLMEKTNILPFHNCCDVCEKKCTCDSEICPNTRKAYQPAEEDDEEEEEEEMIREVSLEDKTILKEKLFAFKFKKALECDSVHHFELLYGLTDEVIDGVIEKCSHIFNPDDVLKLCKIWSYATAVIVCNIVNDVFGDSEMYNVDSESE
jgi:ATP-dependent DNA helicase RecQ